MGKRRRLNKFIRKWIKSDLPEDRSTVLLLGVTRIPTSPVPARRPCSLPLSVAASHFGRPHRGSALLRRNSSKKRVNEKLNGGIYSVDKRNFGGGGESASVPATNSCVSHESNSGAVMERSVDSIGTCSLDVEASADPSSDRSELSSTATLHSVSLKSPPPDLHPHLPSYLSLACTVNGYSTTTNYDPVRLSKSRDASPHRLEYNENLTGRNVPSAYSTKNNLLSPPNLVPLPNRAATNKIMSDHAISQQQREFYRSAYIKEESRFIDKNDYRLDLENGHHAKITAKSQSVTYESRTFSINGQNNSLQTLESTKQEFSNGTETKSFIQQRVERLYGPGALAQGFFVKKRLKDETDYDISLDTSKHHNISLPEKLLKNDMSEGGMKQSTSSPTLPVLRHLRPEFRAQLPIINSRKSGEGVMQKSSTVPAFRDEVKVNGHSKNTDKVTPVNGEKPGCSAAIREESGEKNGHYFLKVLQRETERLLQLADNVEIELNNENLSEEVVGIIRSAAGKARLLVSQKMQQFKGLCANNITQVAGEAFPTTNEDLQGFWDMVMLQVDQVDALFKEINTLKLNNWVEIKVAMDDVKIKMNGSSNKNKVFVNRARPTSAASEALRKQREAQRKQMIEERRKAIKAQNKKEQNNIEIFVPESS